MSAPNRTVDVLRTALTLQEVLSVRAIKDTMMYMATALTAPQGQDNSIASDPVKLTQPTQHASRWRMRQGRGGQFDGVKYRYAGR